MKENVSLIKCKCNHQLSIQLRSYLTVLLLLLGTTAGYAENKSLKKQKFILVSEKQLVFDATAKTFVNVQQQKNIRGKVTDVKGESLPGVTIVVEGTTRGVITDVDGTYSIEALPTDKLVFSYVGMEIKTIEVKDQTQIDVVLSEKIDELEEVTIVAFGKQKKESVISSIETVRVQDLRVPSSNLTTAFAGKMAGMISYQTSGEPGQDNAQFFIRGVSSFGTGKVDPLILIDNVEVTANELSRLHPDDIASFSIVKDATGTALYGARAANGVILVTTKEGKEGSIKVSFRAENAFSSPTSKIDMADPITYMRLANEASKTRDPLSGDIYSQEKIDNTIRGTNPMVYPTTDWMDILFKDVTSNQRVNLNISGGGNIAQYYIAGSFTQDNGVMKVDNRNNFNTNIDLKNYNIRSNINLNLTPSTQAKVRVHGVFQDYTGPIPGGSDLYQQALNVSPVRFPAYYEPDEIFAVEEHILFGNQDGQFLNPYAEMVKGYRESSSSVMSAQFELSQDLSKWVQGLNIRGLLSTNRTANFSLSRSYNPFYYQIDYYDRFTDTYRLQETNADTGTEYLSYDPGYKSIYYSTYSEAAISYNRNFGKHDVSGMLVGITHNSVTANASTLTESLPNRNLGISGRFTYGYESKYFGEFNFGYNGSEKFDAGHRWGFFPSIGMGWQISNEPFWNNVKTIIPKFKIKGTYGKVGNDQIGATRFFYLSDVIIRSGAQFQTGLDFGKQRTGTTIVSYPNPNITWELSYKTNLGLELGLFKGMDILVDFFHERRTRILQTRADIPDELGLWKIPQANVGEAKSKGVDLSIDYNHSFNKDMWLVGRGTFTYARSIYSYYEEPDFSEYPWRSRIALPIRQTWGYIAERLFIDEADIANSPRQDFGEYLPGDIKYKDLNNDNIINELDLAPIGYPTVPEINYGFGVSFGYKDLDLSFFFQGSARSSFWIDAQALTPFVRSGRTEGGLAQFIVDDYWSESSQNPYAYWPRLSPTVIANNVQTSTKFMENGDFLRLKSAEIGYSLPTRLVDKLKLDKFRVYINGTNLLLFSKFKLWDVEMGGSGLGYPLQRVFNTGINISF